MQINDMKEFMQEVEKAVKEALGEDYRVQLQEVVKNNGVTMQGLVILSKMQNVSPTIYLEPFWSAYQEEISLEAIVEMILGIYKSDMPAKSIAMDFFKDFGQVKDRICYKLIHREENRGLLREIPHMEFLDLAICFFYAYQGEELGEGTILIHDRHVEMWNTSASELFALAKENTPRIFPWECRPMDEVIREIMEDREEWEQEKLTLPPGDQLPMQILSNRQHVHGASCILYPGVLEQLSEKEDCDFYILPSSIHEVILLKDSKDEDTVQLKEMIWDVNRTQVAPEEILSGSLYHFSRVEKRLNIV